MKKIILFTIFIASFSTAQIIQEDEQIFTFSDEFNNSQEIIIGKNPWATEGLDSILGEEYIPQVPSGQFGIRFQLPPDTSITTIKDIRFGCYWATGFYHLIDVSYASGSSTITVEWNWGSGEEGRLDLVFFYDPYTGELLDYFSWSQGIEYFVIPSQLDKIQLSASYSGTLSSTWYKIYSPNGGEIIPQGEECMIAWTGGLLPPYMDIEFSSDSGTTWNYIVQNLSTINSSYNWIVPAINSDKCLIRIGNYPCDIDQSDSCFTITYPVEVNGESNLPTEFSLSQNYPNPFNPSTKIKYTIPSVTLRQAQSDILVTIKVYDVLGNEVATLVNEEKPAGEYEIVLTVGRDSSPDIASGIYFYQLKAGSFIETKKMILLK